MGRTNYSEIGRGFSEEQARHNAIASARDMYGDQEGYSGSMASATGENDKVKCIKKPKLAKLCKVEKASQKGTRRWETVFVIEPQWLTSKGDRIFLANGTQGEALKKAKVLALKNQTEYVVRIEKRLATGDNKIATVEPKKSEVGEWLFTGLARC
jgi:hypothetical protein